MESRDSFMFRCNYHCTTKMPRRPLRPRLVSKITIFFKRGKTSETRDWLFIFRRKRVNNNTMANQKLGMTSFHQNFDSDVNYPLIFISSLLVCDVSWRPKKKKNTYMEMTGIRDTTCSQQDVPFRQPNTHYSIVPNLFVRWIHSLLPFQEKLVPATSLP